MDLRVRPNPHQHHVSPNSARDVIDERYNSIPGVSKPPNSTSNMNHRDDRRYQLTTKNSSRATMTTAASSRFSLMGDSDRWTAVGQSQMTLNSHGTASGSHYDEATKKRAEENAAFVRLLEGEAHILSEGGTTREPRAGMPPKHNSFECSTVSNTSNTDLVSSPFQRTYLRRNYQDTMRPPSTSHTNRPTERTASPPSPQPGQLGRQGPMGRTGGRWLPDDLDEVDDEHDEGDDLLGKELTFDSNHNKKNMNEGMDVPLNAKAKAVQQNRRPQQQRSSPPRPQPQHHEEFDLTNLVAAAPPKEQHQYRHPHRQEQPQYPLNMALELADQDEQIEAELNTNFSKMNIFQPPQEGDGLRLQCETAADEAAKATAIFDHHEGRGGSPSRSSPSSARRNTTGATARPSQKPYFPSNTPRASTCTNSRSGGGGSPPALPQNVSRGSFPAISSRPNMSRSSSRESLPSNLGGRDSNRRSPHDYQRDIDVQCDYPVRPSRKSGANGYLYPSPPQQGEEDVPHKLLPPIEALTFPTNWQGLNDGGTPDDDMLDLEDERPWPPPAGPPPPENTNNVPPPSRDRRRPRRSFSYDTEMTGLGTVLTAEPAYAQLTLEVSPGVHMPFRGSEETWKAISHGRIVKTDCVACTLHLYCVDDAEFVVCPECQTISPVMADTNRKRRKKRSGGGGLGLGFLEEQLNKWQADLS